MKSSIDRIMLCTATFFIAVLCSVSAQASVFGTVRINVLDPQNLAVANAEIILHAKNSDWSRSSWTNSEGQAEFATVPIGQYLVSVVADGFAKMPDREIEVISDTVTSIPVQMQLEGVTRYQVPNTPDQQLLGVRDIENADNTFANFSWVHTPSPALPSLSRLISITTTVTTSAAPMTFPSAPKAITAPTMPAASFLSPSRSRSTISASARTPTASMTTLSLASPLTTAPAFPFGSANSSGLVSSRFSQKISTRCFPGSR